MPKWKHFLPQNKSSVDINDIKQDWMPVTQAAIPESPGMEDVSGDLYEWEDNILDDSNQVETMAEEIWMLNPEVRWQE